jgi:hypothetical protein
MEINRENLEKVLNTELVGKDVGYSHWNFTGALLKIMRIIAKEAGLNENDFSYKAQGTNSAYLTYKGVSFGDATFQKQKGKYHYGSYEWTFKKCFVNLWCDDRYSHYAGLDFAGMLAKIESDLQSDKDREAKKLAKAKEIFQKIKEELNAKDDYEVTNFIEYMNKNKYSLRQ